MGKLHRPTVVKVESAIGPVGFRLGRLLLDGGDPVLGIEGEYAVRRRIHHLVAKNGRPLFSGVGGGQQFAQFGSVKEIIPKNQAGGGISNELGPDVVRLGQPLRLGLFGVGDGNPHRLSIPQKALEKGQVMRRGDQQDFPNARQHENRKRIVHHRLVIEGQKLFGDRPGQRP